MEFARPGRPLTPLSSWLIASLIGLAGQVHAQEPPVNQTASEKETAQSVAAPSEPDTTASLDWHYGAYLDLSYDQNFNYPANHLFRNRTTTSRTNELAPNMALAYVRKDASASSHWGMELGVQGGYDTDNFAYLNNEPRVGGYDVLRHFSRANLSWVEPIGGRDLTVTAGLFNSLIGYESLYAKDNFNYTRSWIADNTPYMMFGVNAKYQLNDRVAATLFLVNAYYHLAHPNDQPSYGGQVAWKPTSRITVTNTLFYGPNQQNTALEFWRAYSNNIVEWKGDEVTVALAYDVGTEKLANAPNQPQTFVMGGDVEASWHIVGPWRAALRPEFYWDRNGRWTGSEQLVRAITTTLEYQFPYSRTNTRLRLEHRYDESTGKQGGFFTGGEIRPGVIALTPGQHLLILGLLWTFDSP